MIETERLHLRPHRIDDLRAMHEVTAPPNIRRHLSGPAPTLEDSYAHLLRTLGGWAEFGYGSFAVIERETDRYVGGVGVFRMLRTIDKDALEGPEAGWIIAEDRWGQGYAGEAMAAAQAWFDAAHGPQRTVCMIMPGNTASERVAARLGYRWFRDGRHKDDPARLYERPPTS